MPPELPHFPPRQYTEARHIEELRAYLDRIEKMTGSADIVHLCQAALSIRPPAENKSLPPDYAEALGPVPPFPPLNEATFGQLIDEIGGRMGCNTVERTRAQEALRNLTEWIVAAGFPLNQPR